MPLNWYCSGYKWQHSNLGKPSFKKSGILWNFFTNGGEGSIGFHISYSELHIFRNTVKVLNKDFIKAVRGGGITVLWKFFIRFSVFFSTMASLIPDLCINLVILVNAQPLAALGPPVRGQKPNFCHFISKAPLREHSENSQRIIR